MRGVCTAVEERERDEEVVVPEGPSGLPYILGQTSHTHPVARCHCAENAHDFYDISIRSSK